MMRSRILYNTMSAPQTPPSKPPSAQVLEMAFGYVLSRCVYCVTQLGIADLLQQGPRSAADLASASNSNADALARTLRALTSVGMFTETEPGVFGLTALAEPPPKGAPDSCRAMVLFLGDHLHWPVYEQLPY